MSAAVGGLPNASDPDVNNLVFSITGGNAAGVFAISACLGQLRVARAVLDYMTGPRQYNLTVTVTDDGYPPMNATANFTINLVCGGQFCITNVTWTVELGTSAMSVLSCLWAPTG